MKTTSIIMLSLLRYNRDLMTGLFLSKAIWIIQRSHRTPLANNSQISVQLLVCYPPVNPLLPAHPPPPRASQYHPRALSPHHI